MEALEFVNKVLLMMAWPSVDTVEGSLDEETSRVVSASNDVLAAIQNDREWQTLAVEGYLEMEASTTSTAVATITYGSTSLVLDQSVFVVGDIGKQVMVAGTKTAYTIAAVVSGTNATLNRAWVDDDLAEEREIYIGQSTYDLPEDYDRMTVDKLFNPRADNYIAIVDSVEMGRRRSVLGLGLNIGEPEKCTIRGVNSSGTAQKIHFDYCASDNYSLEYSYQKKHPVLSTDTALIAYPPKDMLYILDMIKARLDRDSELSQTAGQLANEAMTARNKQQQNKESGSSSVQFTPDTGSMGRYRRRRR